MSTEFEDFEEDDMPCPCQKCHTWFDLHDGRGSDKWYPGTVICSSCHDTEQDEIETDDRIEELERTIADATYDLRVQKNELKRLKAKQLTYS